MELKQIREEKGISQKELANALGVTESAISHWESGRYLPTADKLPMMAKTLDCTIDALFTNPKEKLEAKLNERINNGEITIAEAEHEYQDFVNPEPRYSGQEF